MKRQRGHGGRNVVLSITAVTLVVMWWNLTRGLGAKDVAQGDAYQRGVAVQAQEPVKMFVDADGKEVDPEDTQAWIRKDVTWFTILNAPRYYWCEMLGSAWHNKITMNIYGWGDNRFDGWLATWLKIPIAIKFSEGLPEGSMMGFVDGADSLFQRETPAILEAYRELLGTENLFVMSSEINCAVQSLPHHACNNTNFPMTPWGRRYLNSGLYLGPSDVLRGFLQHVEKHYLPLYKEGTVQRNDQSVIGKAYHDGWRNNFTIDAYTKLFQSVRMAEGHYCQAEGNNQLLPVPDAATGLLKNCLTGNTPSIFHFNGKAKPFLGKWIKKYWWYGKSIPSNAVVFLNKKPTSLKQLCPKLSYH